MNFSQAQLKTLTEDDRDSKQEDVSSVAGVASLQLGETREVSSSTLPGDGRSLSICTEDFRAFNSSDYLHTAGPEVFRVVSDVESSHTNDDRNSLIVNGKTATNVSDAGGLPKYNYSTWTLREFLASMRRRISRSASSLLSQHSPSLNEIIDNPPPRCGEGSALDNFRFSETEGSYVQNEFQRLNERIQELEREQGEKEQWMARTEQLEAELKSLQEENALLRGKDSENSSEKETKRISKSSVDGPPSGASNPVKMIQPLQPLTRLDPEHIARYSRQLLLSDGFGVKGQCKLLSSSVLVIGAGGIGSPLLLYLAASGIGRITIIDFDSVDMSNLHRQVIHENANVGMNKAVSACNAIKALNPSIECTPVQEPLTHKNALYLVSKHDCVVDASDNPRTRYFVNDACVLAGKPLVSGSAMGTEGQLTVYNYKNGPCYRCMYPKPNPAEGCKSCSDNGVLGPVPGMIGVLQATEVLKVLTGFGSSMSDRLLMYDSLQCSFLNIKKPPRRKNCPVCGPEATIKTMQDSQNISEVARGPAICTFSPTTSAVSNESSLDITCKDYNIIRQENKPHVLLDVRVERQVDLCTLDGAVNIPLRELKERLTEVEEMSGGTKPVYCLCRRGIASLNAAQILSSVVAEFPGIHSVYNIKGGLDAWRQEVDNSFPVY